MSKINSYEDNKYNRAKDIYNILLQSFEDVKHERNGKHGWNKPVNEMAGISFRLMPTSQLEITYHRYEVTTREGLLRQKGVGYEFVKEVVKELKTKFRELTKKTLTLKEAHKDESFEKTSILQAPTSGYFGNSLSRPYGRMLIRNSIIYDFDATL